MSEFEGSSCEGKPEVTGFQEGMTILVGLILLAKTTLFDVNIFRYVKRYKETYNTWR